MAYLDEFVFGKDYLRQVERDLNIFFPNRGWTIRGNWYNPDEYDLVPKKGFVERLVKEKEEEISELDKRREKLLKEKEELLRK